MASAEQNKLPRVATVEPPVARAGSTAGPATGATGEIVDQNPGRFDIRISDVHITVELAGSARVPDHAQPFSPVARLSQHDWRHACTTCATRSAPSGRHRL